MYTGPVSGLAPMRSPLFGSNSIAKPMNSLGNVNGSAPNDVARWTKYLLLLPRQLRTPLPVVRLTNAMARLPWTVRQSFPSPLGYTTQLSGFLIPAN